MNFQIKGALKRAKLEYKYYNSKNWSFQDTGKFWDTVHNYNEVGGRTYAYKRRFYDNVKLCSVKDKGMLLDIDCRTGNGTLFYYRKGKVRRAVCVSPSEVLLNVAKKRLKKHNIKAETKLLRKLPLRLKSEIFDTVLCLETFEHVPKKDCILFLKELNRVLKKDGKMIFSTPNRLWEFVHWFAAVFNLHPSEGPHRFLSRKKVVKYLKLGGFNIKKEKTTVIIPSGPRVLTKTGEVIERLLGERIMRLIGLRRIFICEKKSEEF